MNLLSCIITQSEYKQNPTMLVDRIQIITDKAIKIYDEVLLERDLEITSTLIDLLTNVTFLPAYAYKVVIQFEIKYSEVGNHEYVVVWQSVTPYSATDTKEFKS